MNITKRIVNLANCHQQQDTLLSDLTIYFSNHLNALISITVTHVV